MATKLSDVIQRGTHAARPAASLAGIQYFETDTGLLLRDNGSSWDSMSLAALVTAKGDLLAGTGAGAVARLGVGTDGLPVVADSSQASGLNYGNIIGGTAFAPSGLTGSVAASRYVGATASVAPTTGAHLLGDWVTTQDGKVFICTTAGTPGTWTQVSGSGTFTGEVAGTDFAPTGLTGSTAASRYVGATASGAPASGAHLLGDFVIDQTGFVYVCTTAGTPGTWTKVGGASGAMTQIADQTVTGSVAATITFSSIPGTYNHLLLVLSLRTNDAANTDTVWARMNSDSGANYSWQNFNQTNSGGAAANTNGDTSARFMRCSAASSRASDFSGASVWLYNYAGTTPNKAYNSTSGLLYSSTNIYTEITSGEWISTSAITQIVLTPSAGSFAVGSRVTLYGIS